MIVYIGWKLGGNDVEVEPDTKRRFGTRIRDLRTKRGWTQLEMADLFGISRVYVSKIETGKCDPSLTILKVFADGFSITVSKLLEGV